MSEEGALSPMPPIHIGIAVGVRARFVIVRTWSVDPWSVIPLRGDLVVMPLDHPLSDDGRCRPFNDDFSAFTHIGFFQVCRLDGRGKASQSRHSGNDCKPLHGNLLSMLVPQPKHLAWQMVSTQSAIGFHSN